MAAGRKHDGDRERARTLDAARNVLAKCHHMITGDDATSQPVAAVKPLPDQGDRNIARMLAR